MRPTTHLNTGRTQLGGERSVWTPGPAGSPVVEANRQPVDQQCDRLWDIRDVSAFLRVPVATIYQWRVRGEGPPATRMGKHLRFEPGLVRAWVGAHREDAHGVRDQG